MLKRATACLVKNKEETSCYLLMIDRIQDVFKNLLALRSTAIVISYTRNDTLNNTARGVRGAVD